MRRVVVVGAGPAGTAAARAAASFGVEVLLIDEGPETGAAGGLPDEVERLFLSVVWAIERTPGGHRVHVRTGSADATDRSGRSVETRALILATGSHDRVLPFPGWDLPGVRTAGAARAIAENRGIAAGERVIVSGTGPVLLRTAAALVEAGARVKAVLEAGDPVGGFAARPDRALAGWAKAGELARCAATLARHDVPLSRRSAVIAAFGEGRVEAVLATRLDREWRPVPPSRRRFEVDTVVLGYGRAPRLEAAAAAGCDIEGGAVAVNAAQATSVPGVFAAGGGLTGVGGADRAEGVVAGTAAAKLLGARVRAPVKEMRRARAGRRAAAALAEAYPVGPGWREWLRDDTLVCPCEAVDYGTFRRTLEAWEVGDLRSLGSATRAGAGSCRGRVCGRNLAELADLSEAAGAAVRGPLVVPVRLGELAEDAPVDEGP